MLDSDGVTRRHMQRSGETGVLVVGAKLRQQDSATSFALGTKPRDGAGGPEHKRRSRALAPCLGDGHGKGGVGRPLSHFPPGDICNI